MPVTSAQPVVTPGQFRTDFPEFQDPNIYSDSAITYWLAVATLLLSPSRWGLIGPVCASGQFQFMGQPANLDTVIINGVTITFVAGSPSGYQVQIGANVAATIASLVTFLAASVNPKLSVLTYSGNSPYLTVTAKMAGTGANSITLGGSSTQIAVTGSTLTGGANPGGMIVVGTELFVAHNLVLEAQAQDASLDGGWPGISKGAINSEVAGQVTVSYESVATLEEGAGNWNLTMYGTRFYKLSSMAGMGPIQISNGGCGLPGTVPGIQPGTPYSGPNMLPSFSGFST